MIIQSGTSSSRLRGVLYAVALVLPFSACTRTEITEVDCAPTAEEQQAHDGDGTAGSRSCQQRRVRLVFQDKYSEPEVVTDETW